GDRDFRIIVSIAHTFSLLHESGDPASLEYIYRLLLQNPEVQPQTNLSPKHNLSLSSLDQGDSYPSHPYLLTATLALLFISRNEPVICSVYLQTIANRAESEHIEALQYMLEKVVQSKLAYDFKPVFHAILNDRLEDMQLSPAAQMLQRLLSSR